MKSVYEAAFVSQEFMHVAYDVASWFATLRKFPATRDFIGGVSFDEDYASRLYDSRPPIRTMDIGARERKQRYLLHSHRRQKRFIYD